MCGTLKTANAGLMALVSILGLSGIASAQGLGEILDCRVIAEDLERLRCFDETAKLAAEGLSAVLANDGKESAAATQAARDDPQNPEDSFGAEDLARQRGKETQDEPKMLRAKMAEWHFTRAGKYELTLENGQIWRQISGDSNRLHLPGDPSDGVVVIIKKGLFGSHVLRTQSSKRTIKVKRVE